MKHFSVCSCAVLGVFFLFGMGASVKAKTTIVVHRGPFDTVQAGAHGEAGIDWMDADKSDDTACTECFAAVELQRYLRKMTGREDDFAILDDQNVSAGDLIQVDDQNVPAGDLILVGPPTSNTVSKKLAPAMGMDEKTLAGLGSEGYRIKTAAVNGHRVTLVAGGDRVGTLYGVYDLLYRNGCRWFGPGELHEVVPRVETLGAIDVTERPSHSVRGFRGRFDRPKPGMDFLLWMARNRLNLWSVEATSDPNVLRKLGIKMGCGGHTALGLFLNPESSYPYNHPRFQGDEALPADPYPRSDQYRDDADRSGTLSYFEAHPEWFTFNGKQRVKGLHGEGGANFCTSNHDAVKEFAKNHVQALIDGIYKDADIVRLWTVDTGDWCQCEKCKALGSHTDRYLRLLRDFDQEVKKAQTEGRLNRPIVVHFLIYLDVLEPPTRPLPEDFDYETCVGTFFPIRRCYLHNFDQPDCRRNADYSKQLHGWAIDPQRHYRGRLCIGEYYNVSRYKALPICFMHTMAHDIPYYYHTAGARHFHYMHCTTGNWGNKSLTNYQMARQIWNVDENCELLWKDFFAKRYGPVSKEMRSFYESLEKMLGGVTELKYSLAMQLDKGKKDLFPDSHLRYRREPGVDSDGTTLVEMMDHAKECRQQIEKALAAEVPDAVKARLVEDERLFRYGEQTVVYYDACVRAYQAAYAGKAEEARRCLADVRRIADLLRQDTTSASPSFGSEDASAANALDATLAIGALNRLEKLIPEGDL